MNRINIETMHEYCILIKTYVLEYNKLEFGVALYGDFFEELKSIINNQNIIEDKIFYLTIAEFVGKLTRVLQGNFKNVISFSWMGNASESFTRDYFITTLKSEWSEL